VGVVRNTTVQPLDPEIDPRLYVPYAQDPGRQVTLTVRTHGAPERLARGVAESVSSVDPTLAIDPPLSGDERLAAAVWPVRFFNTFATISSVFGLLIAGAGVYGLTRYLALARTREIGLRMALGADVSAVIAMIVRQTGVPMFAGLGCGLAGSVAISRLLAAVVLGVKPFDASAFAVATAVLLIAAATAVGLPAFRAARVSPVDALRAE
jgi:predicted lysophospholipase L1 biosynthesis ABC-type transport system permease subunit